MDFIENSIDYSLFDGIPCFGNDTAGWRVSADRINDLPRLSEEEEISLFESMAHGDLKAREKIILYNRYIVIICLRLYYPWLIEDKENLTTQYFQAGIIGLIKAVDKYKPKRGDSFYSYALPAIKNAITDELTQKYLISIGKTGVKNHWRIKRFVQEYLVVYNKFPSLHEISEATELKEKSIKEDILYLSNVEDFESLDNAGCDPENEDIPLYSDADRLAYKAYCENGGIENAVLTPLYSSAITQALYKALEELPEIEKEIIQYRYGLWHTPIKTYEQLAELYGKSRDTIKNIENNALKDMQAYFKEKGYVYAS